MKKLCLALVLACLTVPLTGQERSAVELSSRPLADGTLSLLVRVAGPAGTPVDEVRIELPRGAAEQAVPLLVPDGWKAERDGNAIRLSGGAAMPPFRMRVTLFDVKELQRSRVRLRARQRNLLDDTFMVASLPAVKTAASPAGYVQLPSLVSAGETIEMEVLDPKTTPPDGQWFVAGVEAAESGTNRVKVTLPQEMPSDSGLRVTYFDAWGERILDALAPPDVVMLPTSTAAARTPQITGCSRVGFLGQSLCVCGNFPEASRTGLTVDGQPAEVMAASQQVVHVRLPETLAPGPHTIAGDSAAGFSASDQAMTRALRLRAALDANALLRGQSTTMRLSVDGAVDPVVLAVTNRTPGIIAIPGGNYQEITIPPDPTQVVERPVNARMAGAFLIDTQVPVPPCPCMQRPDQPSTASQPAPVVVPRRVLATIAVAAPPVMLATAQAIAVANNLAVLEVTPLPLAGAALATFEILDGVPPVAKAAAVAATPNVLLSQPDFIYDTSQSAQAAPAPAAGPRYGPGMIGADVARSVSTGDGVRVAVIDTGLDSEQASLQKRVGAYVDVTGTGWTPDTHGTLVAGVIAADSTGPDGPAGVAPGATLIGVRRASHSR